MFMNLENHNSVGLKTRVILKSKRGLCHMQRIDVFFPTSCVDFLQVKGGLSKEAGIFN